MMLYTAGTNSQELANKINSDLFSFHTWLCDNNLSLDTDKTKFIIVGNKAKLSRLEYDIQIKVMCVKLATGFPATVLIKVRTHATIGGIYYNMILRINHYKPIF
ncbi:hypothetical protein WA026_019570 [Henosepilachna vigintioctopunctata]|uniref:Uncharacterized protein n=1 Tax=Henosepilachna vigintioctopunctata TaxID=420089 RepID=A0AAW1TMN9_9CUCU